MIAAASPPPCMPTRDKTPDKTPDKAGEFRTMPTQTSTRRILAVAVSVAVLVVVAALVRSQPAVVLSTKQSGPDDNVRGMLQASQAGDVAAYLNCFAGDLRDRLAARLKRLPSEPAAAELRADTQNLKSFVTTNWKQSAADEATMVLERVYTDYNERHLVRVRRIGDEWKVVELTPMERFAPQIPYGTPVYSPPAQPDVAEDEAVTRSRQEPPRGATPPTAAPTEN